jgi:hypothetical protein
MSSLTKPMGQKRAYARADFAACCCSESPMSVTSGGCCGSWQQPMAFLLMAQSRLRLMATQQVAKTKPTFTRMANQDKICMFVEFRYYKLRKAKLTTMAESSRSRARIASTRCAISFQSLSLGVARVVVLVFIFCRR